MARHRLLLSVATAAVILALPPIQAQAPFQSVRVQIIDRGQADGMLIRTPNSQWVVIDSGTNSLQADAMENVWGVDRLALLVTSHRHFDHYGGTAEILRRFPVDLYVGNLADCLNRTTDDTIRTVLNDRNIQSQSLGAETITVDGVDFIILPPDPVDDACPEDENDNSIVVRMEFGDFSMLFTGDAETDEREWLMEHHPGMLDVDVLKAAHHGASNGADGSVNGQTWMDVVDPEDVVISVLRNSPHGHPHNSAMTVYENAVGEDNIHCTSRHGTVRVYGYADGRQRIFHQFDSDESCRFSG